MTCENDRGRPPELAPDEGEPGSEADQLAEETEWRRELELSQLGINPASHTPEEERQGDGARVKTERVEVVPKRELDVAREDATAYAEEMEQRLNNYEGAFRMAHDLLWRIAHRDDDSEEFDEAISRLWEEPAYREAWGIDNDSAPIEKPEGEAGEHWPYASPDEKAKLQPASGEAVSPSRCDGNGYARIDRTSEGMGMRWGPCPGCPACEPASEPAVSPSEGERTYPLWVCDNCGDHAECEPGETCEVCEKGTIQVVQFVPASERDQLQQELREARTRIHDLEEIILTHWRPERDRAKSEASTYREALEKARDTLRHRAKDESLYWGHVSDRDEVARDVFGFAADLLDRALSSSPATEETRGEQEGE